MGLPNHARIVEKIPPKPVDPSANLASTVDRMGASQLAALASIAQSVADGNIKAEAVLLGIKSLADRPPPVAGKQLICTGTTVKRDSQGFVESYEHTWEYVD
jgi:hypothetical protein